MTLDRADLFDYPANHEISFRRIGKMSDDYRGLAIFVAVHDAGSFSAAGRRLKLSTSVVSHHVSKLEERLGVPLFFRSTRSLSLTSEGHRILEAARRMVAAGQEALDALADDSEQPVGTLRITLPAFGLNSDTHQAIWRFARQHPMVALSVKSSDRMVDLVSEGYDLAVRLGQMSDSTLKSRRIGSFHRKLVAAPSYVDDRGPVRDLNDLISRDFVLLDMTPRPIKLLRMDEEVTVVPETYRLEVDTVVAGKAAVLAGLGIMSLPLHEIEAELQSGALVDVLPDWQLPVLGIFAVWPDAGQQKNLTRRLIDFLVESKAKAL